MRERVNRKIKFREEFRPFAPACLPEELKRWFILPENRAEYMTPFMCCVAEVTEEGRKTFPATTHVDGTARVQRVEPSHNPLFHELLTRFKERSGVGVLLNTSLNLKDEPICNSHGEAFATFMRSEMDFLVVEDCLVTKADCQRLGREEYVIDQSQIAKVEVAGNARPLNAGARRKVVSWIGRLVSPLKTLEEFARLTRRSGRALWLMSMMLVLSLLAILLVVIQVIEYVAPFVYTIF
jgi:hypothetical protein